MSDVFDKEGPERLVAGGTWFLLLMILGGIFAVMWGIVLSRAYGPVVFGIFSTANSAQNFAWVLVFGGLSRGLMKYGSEYVTSKNGRVREFFTNSVKYMTIIGVVACLILSYIALSFSDPVMRIMIFSVGLSLLFSGTKDALGSILGSFQKNDYLSMINSSRLILIFIIGTIFILMNVSSYMISILVAIGTIAELTLSIYLFRIYVRDKQLFRHHKFFGDSEETETGQIASFTNVAKFGIYISIAMISFNVMKSLDIIVLKSFFDYAKVGVYSVADGASSILFYMTSFALPVIPAITEAYVRNDKELLEKYIKIAVKYPLIIGTILTTLIFMLAEPIILYLYGEAFVGAIVPLKILIVGTFMLMFGYNLSSVLIGVGKSKLAGGIMAFAAIQYLISLYILAPMFGFNGAAAALTLTGVTLMILVPYFVYREFKVNIYEDTHLVLLSAMVMVVFLLAVPKGNAVFVIVGIFSSIGVFLSSLYLLEYITADDLSMFGIAMTTFRRKNKTGDKFTKRIKKIIGR